MEAVNAQLQHGRHPRALSRGVQLLQACSQEPLLLDACAQSGTAPYSVLHTLKHATPLSWDG